MLRKSLRYAVVGSALAVVGATLAAPSLASTPNVTVTVGIVNDHFTGSTPDTDGAWRTLDTPGSVVNHACLTHEDSAAAVATPAVVGGSIPNPCTSNNPPLDSL